MFSGTESQEKMILLLLILTSSAGGEVKVTQKHYQAEEKHHITLEWTFTTNTDHTAEVIHMYCRHSANEKSSLLYDVYEGVEHPEIVHEGFSGRVQMDTDALREGRIRLHLSRLRTEDSGLYWCAVMLDLDSEYSGAMCELTVSAAAAAAEKQMQSPPAADTGGQTGLTIGLTAAGGVLLFVMYRAIVQNRNRKNK